MPPWGPYNRPVTSAVRRRPRTPDIEGDGLAAAAASAAASLFAVNTENLFASSAPAAGRTVVRVTDGSAA